MLGVPFLDSRFLQWFRPQVIDDTVDRINYFATASLLVFFSIMVSAKQYVGSPIQCWMPMEFKGGWEQYAEDYCFIQDTFFIPFHKEIPEDSDDRDKAQIGYYQWVPIVLVLMALFFYLPCFVWNSLHRQSGIDIQSAIDDSNKLRGLTGEVRKTETQRMASYLEEWLDFRGRHHSPARVACFRFGTTLGSYVSMLYIIVKFLYLFNVVVQLYILSRFVGSNYYFWGFETLYDLWNGREWSESGVFPRVTLCDFRIRRLANIHRYTVQCVLMLNMFNEKIFLFLWFWFFFVAVSTFINFIYTFCYLSFTRLREKNAKFFLISLLDENERDIAYYKNNVKQFVKNALRTDGVLLLKFIESHSGTMVAKDLTIRMFNDYLEMIKEKGTKSTTPGFDEYLYTADKRYLGDKQLERTGLMAPDSAKLDV